MSEVLGIEIETARQMTEGMALATLVVAAKNGKNLPGKVGSSSSKATQTGNTDSKLPSNPTSQAGSNVANPGGSAVASGLYSFDANEVRLSQNTVSFNKVDRVTGKTYTYDDLVSSMKKDGWKGDPVDVVKCQMAK